MKEKLEISMLLVICTILIVIWAMLLVLVINALEDKRLVKGCEKTCQPYAFEWNQTFGCTCKSK